MNEESLNQGIIKLKEIKAVEEKISKIDRLITASNSEDDDVRIEMVNSNGRNYFDCDSPEDFISFLNTRKTAQQTLLSTLQTEFEALWVRSDIWSIISL